MNDLEVGKERIRQAVAAMKQQYPNAPIFFVKLLRQFGDVCHSTIVVRHYRRTNPDAVVIWGISEKYVSEFEAFKSLPDGPHMIVGLPHGPIFPYDRELRVAWVRYAETLGIRVIKCAVHPWGERSGSIIDSILQNAGIRHLAVPRRPVIPVDISDYSWCDQYLAQNQLWGWYVTLEYLSYSLPVHDLNWYAELIKLIKCPVVAFASKNEPMPAGAVDARGCTYRQAKTLIMRSKCFVGCASGNGLLAVSEGCETPMVEIVDRQNSYLPLKYLNANRVHSYTGFSKSPAEVAAIINSIWL